MNCGHSDVLGKIDLKSVKRRPARGVLGGAESVDCYKNSDGIDLPHVADEIVRLLVAADLDDALSHSLPSPLCFRAALAG